MRDSLGSAVLLGLKVDWRGFRFTGSRKPADTTHGCAVYDLNAPTGQSEMHYPPNARGNPSARSPPGPCEGTAERRLTLSTAI